MKLKQPWNTSKHANSFSRHVVFSKLIYYPRVKKKERKKKTELDRFYQKIFPFPLLYILSRVEIFNVIITLQINTHLRLSSVTVILLSSYCDINYSRHMILNALKTRISEISIWKFWTFDECGQCTWYFHWKVLGHVYF